MIRTLAWEFSEISEIDTLWSILIKDRLLEEITYSLPLTFSLAVPLFVYIRILNCGVNSFSGQTGPHFRGVEIRIDNPDPKTGRGELVVKGPNAMMGYYKDPERTKEAFTEDGWFLVKQV